MSKGQRRKRVLIVGAGAAGMACAEGLSQHPDSFDVTLIGEIAPHARHPRADESDAQGYCGGQAFSIDIDNEKYGSPWMNQGVQGGTFIYQ
jgi:glycine/D-amino acid oxidase-like deaminating enzyme